MHPSGRSTTPHFFAEHIVQTNRLIAAWVFQMCTRKASKRPFGRQSCSDSKHVAPHLCI
jgi:hypothetical protein